MIAHITGGKAGDMAPPVPEWYGAHALAGWLGVPVPSVVDVPQAWLDWAAIALEAEGEVARKRADDAKRAAR